MAEKLDLETERHVQALENVSARLRLHEEGGAETRTNEADPHDPDTIIDALVALHERIGT